MITEFNILIGNGIEANDFELFFGPTCQGNENDKPRYFTIETKWHTLLKELGIFSSAGDAKKNGWSKEIPSGFTDMTIGKLRTRICILKIL